MGFLLRIIDGSGKTVEQVVADLRFNPVRAGFEQTEFPVMGMLDPYGDTFLGQFQCELLQEEVGLAAARLEKQGVSSEFIVELVRLCEVCCENPQFQLVFIGD